MRRTIRTRVDDGFSCLAWRPILVHPTATGPRRCCHPFPNPAECPLARQPGEPAGDPQISQAFEFRAYEFVRHPNHQEIWACWQHNPGNCLDIGLSISDSMRIELTGCQRDTWLDIQDGSGSPVPLSIFMGSGGGLLGRWL
jgi:hypothetical protein